MNIIEAIEHNKFSIVKNMVANRDDVNEFYVVNNQKISPLFQASLLGYAQIVSFLLKAGANIEYKVNGKTPLYAAVYNGHEDVIKILVENGAIIRSNEQYDPLYIAGATNNKIYKWLLGEYFENVKNLNSNLEEISASEFEVVVVRYKEDIEDLAYMISVEFPNVKVTVYNKGGGDVKLPSNCVVINIDNIGYLGGTYLYHIIHNYNDLAKRVLFLQAEPHYHETFPRLLSYAEYVNSTCDNILAKCLPTTLIKESQDLENTNWSNGRYSKVTLSNYTLIEFANKFIGRMLPETNIKVCWGAQFAVDLEKIRYHDVKFYSAIFSIMNSLIPEVDFFLERSWDIIFKKSTDIKSIISQLKKIDLPGNRIIFPLPNDMFFIVNNDDKFLEVFDAEAGLGHEPHMIKKLLNFAREGETYVEIGANYGDFSLQMSHKLGMNGKIYAFEPGRKVFECLDLSVKLNGLSDIIVTENLAISDKQQDVIFVETGENGAGTLGSHVVVGNKSENDNIVQATTIDAYFENINSSIDILRFDVEGSECKVLKGAEKIISSSPNIRIFVEWQRPLLEKYESEKSMKECLSNLEEKNFIFLDASHLSNSCDHLIFKLSSADILKSNHLEILAVRENTLKEFEEISIDQTYCLNAMNYYLYLASARRNVEYVKNLLSLGADPNSISGLEGNSFGANSLHIAAENGDKELVTTLLNAGANIEAIAPRNELTALCIAAQNKHSDIVQLLIKNAANVECMFPSGANAIYVSAYLGDIKTAIMLLKAGASQDIIIEDKNIIDRANQSGNVEATKLFELGVDLFCQQTSDIQFAEVCGKESNEHV